MKLALYETTPGDVRREKNGLSNIGLDTTRVTLFPPTIKGLNDAIESASRSNAIIVKMEKNYYTADDLLAAVRELVKQGYGKKLFMPSIGIERELVI